MRLNKVSAGVLVSIFVMSAFNGVVFASSTNNLMNTTSTNNLMKTIESAIHSMASSLDSVRAKNLAESTAQYQSLILTNSLVFNSMYETWSFSLAGKVQLETVNVVFTVLNSGKPSFNIVMSEDPSLSSVTATEFQNATYHSSTLYNLNWSGYTIYGNSGATNPVYEANAIWVVPSANQPALLSCFLTHCDLGVWSGLTANSGGSSGIVQAGTDSGIYCFLWCGTSYTAWYEFYPAASVTCSNFPVSPGDAVESDVINYGQIGKSTTTYDVYVTNYHTLKVCSVLGQSDTSFAVPYYAQFIAERPYIGGLARLPNFGSLWMEAGMWYSGTWTFVSTPYNAGWYIKDVMQNGGNININVGPISSSTTDWTSTWLTSAGT
jgi:hypothetical protein